MLEVQLPHFGQGLTITKAVWRDMKGERGIPGEHLYAHFFEEGHAGLADVEVMIVDRTNVNDPAGKRRFLGVQIRYLYPEGIEYKRL